MVPDAESALPPPSNKQELTSERTVRQALRKSLAFPILVGFLVYAIRPYRVTRCAQAAFNSSRIYTRARANERECASRTPSAISYLVYQIFRFCSVQLSLFRPASAGLHSHPTVVLSDC